MNLITNYNDLKFAIRCVDVWKNILAPNNELNLAVNYHIKRSRNESDISQSDNKTKLTSLSLQDYLEMLIDVIQDETGTWFFYVDIAGVLLDQVQNKKIFIYQTDSGYVVVFDNQKG